MKLAALLVAGAACLAAAEGESAAELLKRTEAKVLDNDGQMQNYTCVETVVRDYYRPAASSLDRSCSWLLGQRSDPGPTMVLQHEATDRLRLDVAGTQRGEIFSWVGASRFNDDYVDHVVHEGPISTGAFSAFLGVIFGTDARKFTVLGPVTNVNGRRFMEYSFDVPQANSHYKVTLLDGTRIPMAYSGVVRVDAETADPVHLTFRSAELPQASGSCQSVASLDFRRVKIGGRELLLAFEARQRFISRNGREVENSTTFTACREYSSESTISFSAGRGGERVNSADSVQMAPPIIPSGLHFAFALTAPIQADTAAAGDKFTGRLTEPLRDGRHVLAPKGALVEGRLTLVKIFHRPQPKADIGLAPRRIQIQGAGVPITALPEYRSAVQAVRKNQKKGMEIILPPGGEYSGVFGYSGEHIVLQRGFVSEWVTAFHAGAH
jgi:hypothetical protein